MPTEIIIKEFEQLLKKAHDHLMNEYSQLQIGRASAALVEKIVVDVYGTAQPIRSVASISVPDSKTVQIQPWDRSTLSAIEKAIISADLGFNPSNDGIVVRINIPPLTEERRKELTKVVFKMAEESKIAVRNLRHEIMEKIKSMKAANLITEDQQENSQKKIQEKVDHINKEIEASAKQKEQDIMTI